MKEAGVKRGSASSDLRMGKQNVPPSTNDPHSSSTGGVEQTREKTTGIYTGG